MKTIENPYAIDPTTDLPAEYIQNMRILSSIPETHHPILVSKLRLNATHKGKYIVGAINSAPLGGAGMIYFSMNPENDDCGEINVGLYNYYLFEYSFVESDTVLIKIDKESGLFVGRRVCILNPYYKLQQFLLMSQVQNVIRVDSKLNIILL
jgi:hypothetical protein